MISSYSLLSCRMTLHFYAVKTWLGSTAGKMMSGLRRKRKLFLFLVAVAAVAAVAGSDHSDGRQFPNLDFPAYSHCRHLLPLPTVCLGRLPVSARQ